VREVIFIALGFAMGGWYSWRTLRRAAAETANGELADTQPK
jgi:hypothetical protein